MNLDSNVLQSGPSNNPSSLSSPHFTSFQLERVSSDFDLSHVHQFEDSNLNTPMNNFLQDNITFLGLSGSKRLMDPEYFSMFPTLKQMKTEIQGKLTKRNELSLGDDIDVVCDEQRNSRPAKRSKKGSKAVRMTSSDDGNVESPHEKMKNVPKPLTVAMVNYFLRKKTFEGEEEKLRFLGYLKNFKGNTTWASLSSYIKDQQHLFEELLHKFLFEDGTEREIDDRIRHEFEKEGKKKGLNQKSVDFLSHSEGRARCFEQFRKCFKINPTVTLFYHIDLTL